MRMRTRWSERWRGGKKEKRQRQSRDREADKVQVKVQGHLSPQSFITRRSPRTLKRQTKERKERQEQKKIQLHPTNQQPITKQNERTWLRTKPSNQPEKKTDWCFIKLRKIYSIKRLHTHLQGRFISLIHSKRLFARQQLGVQCERFDVQILFYPSW